jgi:hypothetical protein
VLQAPPLSGSSLGMASSLMTACIACMLPGVGNSVCMYGLNLNCFPSLDGSIKSSNSRTVLSERNHQHRKASFRHQQIDAWFQTFGHNNRPWIVPGVNVCVYADTHRETPIYQCVKKKNRRNQCNITCCHSFPGINLDRYCVCQVYIVLLRLDDKTIVTTVISHIYILST